MQLGLAAFALSALLAAAAAQRAGTQIPEQGPRLVWRSCTLAGGCQAMNESRLVLDSNWRWAHGVGGFEHCFEGDGWSPAICSDPEACAKGCEIEGITAEGYLSTYGVEVAEADESVTLRFASEDRKNFGSRIYLTNGSRAYQMFRLKNREFSLDVNVSQLPCGLNGAAYFVEMDASGGNETGANEAGATYGTGYCDAQCPRERWILGAANMANGASKGAHGACCAEMDIWEANSMATAVTAHPCRANGTHRCSGEDCGDAEGGKYRGVCDKDGCDFNPYRLGATGYYGTSPEFQVDTTRPLTVVTQFVTHDGTDAGDLSEIRRFYVQDGEVIPNSGATSGTAEAGEGEDAITDGFCSAQKQKYGEFDDFGAKGGLRQMGEALDRGMVLALSIWDDAASNMEWLDSAFPRELPRDTPGVARGPCPGDESSTPSVLRSQHADASVVFANVAVGEIGSTVRGARRRLSETVLI